MANNLDGIRLINKDTGAVTDYDVADATARARISNLVATAGDGTIPSELVDVRTGADGTVYTTAGDAVRGQVGNLEGRLSGDISYLDGKSGVLETYMREDGRELEINVSAESVETGAWVIRDGAVVLSTGWSDFRAMAFPVESGKLYRFKTNRLNLANMAYFTNEIPTSVSPSTILQAVSSVGSEWAYQTVDMRSPIDGYLLCTRSSSVTSYCYEVKYQSKSQDYDEGLERISTVEGLVLRESDFTRLTPINVINEKKVAYNPTYGLLGFTQNISYFKIGVYQVEGGVTYRLENSYGQSGNSYPLGVLSRNLLTSFTSNDTAPYVEYVSGSGSSTTDQTVEYTPSESGYLYVNFDSRSSLNDYAGLFGPGYIFIGKSDDEIEFALNKKEDAYSNVHEVTPESVESGLMEFDGLEVYSASYANHVKYAITDDMITLYATGASASVSNGYRYALGAFFDSDDNRIGYFGMSENTAYTDYEVDIPRGAAYVIINDRRRSSAYYVKSKFLIKGDLKGDINELQDWVFGRSPWYGKKIVVLGTSVGYGSNANTNYIKEAARYLGYNYVNASVPGQAIHTDSNGNQLTYGSTALSISEYSSQGVTIPSSPASSGYNNYYRTWENIFTEENADADMWVYAVAPNNSIFNMNDWNAFNKSSWGYSDGSPFSDHRSTFIGALLFLMDKMYTLNPNARMVFVLDSAFSYSDNGGKGNIETVANYWGIPVIDLYGNINRSPKSLEVFKSGANDNHPSTYGQQILGRMFAGQLLNYA